MNKRQEAIERSQHWWFCENIVNHKGQIGLLRMDFPRVFILIRDYDQTFTSFEEFSQNVAELNFFNPSDRPEADTEEILIDAWNFLSLFEEEEDRLAIQNNFYEDEETDYTKTY